MNGDSTASPMTRPGDQARSLITISIPVFNEEGNIERLLARLGGVAEANQDYDFEFLFTDNASADRTFELLATAAAADSRIRVLKFTRNFGFQASILANYLDARGAAAIQLDADLQDPPELAQEFLRQWERGYRVVYGVRRSRPENPLLQATRRAYYKLVRRLSATDLPLDAGDFRLVDRVIIEHLRAVKDNTPYLRGIIAELGYPQIGVPYDREARQAGKSKFDLAALIRLAIDGLCSQSTRPLEAITLFGFALSFVSFFGALLYFAWHFTVYGDRAPGFTTLVILILISTGLNAAFVGLLGEYIGRIFKNTRDLPHPIIERRIEPLPAGANAKSEAAG